MVDSNLQRENILPSERAFAYKMKLEAIKNQGARSDLTSAQIGPKLTAAEKVAEEASDTKSQVISLTIDEVYLFQKYLASHSITLMADDQKLPCICID